MSVSGVFTLGPMMSAFTAERDKYPAYAEAIRRSLSVLEEASVKAVYDENESGGHARHVVAEVAKALGVVLSDVGPGRTIWDPENMSREGAAAALIKEERDAAREQAALWKSLAERQDNAAPLRSELRVAERERDELKHRLEYAQYQLRSLTDGLTEDDVDELKATIVRQAREITRLTGESE